MVVRVGEGGRSCHGREEKGRREREFAENPRGRREREREKRERELQEGESPVERGGDLTVISTQLAASKRKAWERGSRHSRSFYGKIIN